MSRLIGAELNRWFSRRLFWVVLLAGLALTVIVIAGAAFSTRPMSAGELAIAEQQYAEALKQAEQDKASCVDEGLSPEECGNWTPTRAEFIRQPPAYPEFAGGMAQAGTLIAAYAALLLGASFIGAEFKTGNLGTWLTYIPSRIPVLASKAVATLIGATVLGVLVIGLFQAGAAGIVAAWSGPAALQPATEAWSMAGRGLTLVVAAALIGFALATLLGSTVGPVGVLLGVLVLQWALGVMSLLFGAPVWLQAAMPDPNFQAALTGRAEIVYFERAANGELIDRVFEVGLAQAVAYLCGLLAVLLATAGWSFTRREVR